MKEVYVLRHADWNLEEDKLSEAGKESAEKLKKSLRDFQLVLSSPFGRARETAKILSNKTPVLDARAGVLNATQVQLQKVNQLRPTHPFGVAGAIFSLPELKSSVREAGEKLVELIRETLDKLSEEHRALIVSHDGTMVSAEKILNKSNFDKLNKTYLSLEGFIVDKSFITQDFKPH
jgi:broad specificity phosphatase PhoE